MPASPETAAALRAATIKAAEAVLPHVGSGDKHAVDLAAVCALRNTLHRSPGFHGVVRIGEGEKDDAPMLYTNEALGVANGKLPLDIAVDPVEGTAKAASGIGGSYSVVVVGEHGSLMPWSGVPYMDKLAVGPEAEHLITADKININGDPIDTLRQVAKALGKKPEQLAVAILDRERNKAYIDAARTLGVDLRLLTGGDLEQGILTSLGNSPSVDILMGSGGAPEAVLQAGAHRAMGRGALQAAWYAPDDASRRKLAAKGHKPDEVYNLKDLAGSGPIAFAATGITTGPLLKGGTMLADGNWQAGQTLVLQKG